MKDLEAALAEKNGYSNELYVQRVRQGVKELHPDKSDEIALIRKELAFVKTILEQLIGQALPETEFTRYNKNVEALKTDVKIGMIQ